MDEGSVQEVPLAFNEAWVRRFPWRPRWDEDEGHGLSASDVELESNSQGHPRGVLKGSIRSTGVPVAVSTLSTGGQEQQQRVLTEIRALADGPDCNYLVRCYGGFVVRHCGSVRMVSEFMDLGSVADLAKRLQGEEVPPDMLACISRQIAEGLDFLHSRELIHRDIQPRCVLHNRQGRVKLGGFGITWDLDMQERNRCGHWSMETYLAPERCLGEHYSFPVDIWSVGMIIHELATGRYPFKDAQLSFPDLFERIVLKPEPRLDPSRLPKPLCEFCALCLTRDVARRPDVSTLRCHEFITRDLPPEGTLAQWLSTH